MVINIGHNKRNRKAFLVRTRSEDLSPVAVSSFLVEGSFKYAIVALRDDAISAESRAAIAWLAGLLYSYRTKKDVLLILDGSAAEPPLSDSTIAHFIDLAKSMSSAWSENRWTSIGAELVEALSSPSVAQVRFVDETHSHILENFQWLSAPSRRTASLIKTGVWVTDSTRAGILIEPIGLIHLHLPEQRQELTFHEAIAAVDTYSALHGKGATGE